MDENRAKNENSDNFEDKKNENAGSADIELNNDLKIDICDDDEAGMSVSVHAAEADASDGSDGSFNILKEIREWVVAIALALIVVGVIKGFLFDFVLVSGHSMDTTLSDGDRLILTKMGYQPQRGDIVVLDAHYKKREAYIAAQKELKGSSFGWFDEFKLRWLPWEQIKYGIEPLHYVKRVMALSGDEINIDENTGTVYVNGTAVDEPYLGNVHTRAYETQFPYTVDEGCIFVMGDNRENSLDSRYTALGPVPHEAVMGKAAFRFWPFNTMSILH